MKENIKHFKIFFTIILLFFTIGQVSSIIYVPALPNITEAFQSSTATIQWSVSSFMLGFTISQFIYGPLSDHFGRRKILLFGILIGLVGSIICISAINPSLLIIGRFVQGSGFGVGGALGYIVLRDLFKGAELAKYGSAMGMAAPLMVGISPILGGYLQTFFGWRSIFVFLLIYGSLLWIVIIFLFQETKHNLKSEKVSLINVSKTFKLLLCSKIFLGYALCNVFAYGGFMAFYTLGPFLLSDLGVSTSTSGWLVATLDIAVIAGSTINIIFVKRVGINLMMIIGIIFMLIAGISMLVCDLLGFVNVFEVIMPAFVFAFGAILIMCNAFSGAMTPFPNISGVSGGLLGGLQMLGGTLSTSAVALFTTFDREKLLSSIYMIFAILSFCALTFLAKSNTRSKGRC